MEYRFNTWRDEQEREMGEMTFFMAGVVMHGIATNENDKARGDKQWVTGKGVPLLFCLINFGVVLLLKMVV